MKKAINIDVTDLKNIIKALSILKGSEIEISSENFKPFATGIVDNISINDDNIILKFTTNTQPVEILRPIKLCQNGSDFVFDYTIKTLKNDINSSNKALATELIDTILEKEQQFIKKSKFFDTKINIKKK